MTGHENKGHNLNANNQFVWEIVNIIHYAVGIKYL